MGFIRLFLAFLVLISHMGYSWYGYNPGVMAVAVFYLLAGHVVAKLWLNAPAEQRLRWFLRDRALRILPQYYVSLGVAIALWWWLQPDSFHVSATPSLFDWFANFSLIPLNYFMFNGVDGFTLLAPSWSLAVEIQFYLLVPWLFAARYRFGLALAVSVSVFTLAQMGYLNPDIYGYRLLPGVLFLFMSGALCIRPSKPQQRLLLGGWLVGLVYVGCLFTQPHNPSFVLEVALGFVVGLPVVWWHSQHPYRFSGVWGRLQQRAGLYSYALFLIHFPMMWLVQPHLGSGPLAVGVIVVLCLLYAELVYRWVESPVWRKFRPFLGVNVDSNRS